MGVWNWVAGVAKETRESLVRKYGRKRSEFPDLEAIEI